MIPSPTTQPEDTLPLFHNVKGVSRRDSETEKVVLLNSSAQNNQGSRYGTYGIEEDVLVSSGNHSLLGSGKSYADSKSYSLRLVPSGENIISASSEDATTFTKVKSSYNDFKATCGTKRAKKIQNAVKVSLLFIATVASSAIFAFQGEFSVDVNQFSVSKFQDGKLNLTTKGEKYPIARIASEGAFLTIIPDKSTTNITYTVTNPVTGTQKVQKAAVLSTRDELMNQQPMMRNFRFDFHGEDLSAGYLELHIESNTTYSFPLAVEYFFFSTDVYNEVIYAAVVLVGVYVLIIFELIHRTLAAMIGALAALAVLAALNYKPNINEVLTWLDYDTLCLLFGMMVLVAIFCETGFFDWLAFQSYKITKGRTWPLITLLCALCGVMSAFLDNVTTILLFTPVTIRLCEVMSIDPKNILIILVMFSNIGGTATAIGDPPNVLIVANPSIARQGGGSINFASFTLHMMVGTVFTSIAGYIVLRIMFRKEEFLKPEDPHEISHLKSEMSIWQHAANSIAVASREDELVRDLLLQKVQSLESEVTTKEHQWRSVHKVTVFEQNVSELEQKYVIKDYVLLLKSVIVFAVVISIFFVNAFVDNLNLSVGWTAMLGAIWLLVLSDYSDLESILHRIEWATLLFFAALFVLMEALTRLRLIEWIADQAQSIIQSVNEESRLAVAIIIIIWMSALASAFIDNIPFTTAMIPVIVELSSEPTLNLPLDPLIWALAFGACLGGNGTLIGASANVVCAGLAENHGHPFTFGQFFKIGFPMMLVTTFVAMCYLLVCHVALDWSV